MRVLALDTTTRAGSLALVDDGRVLLEHTGDGSRSQAERFPTELVDALRAVGWSTADIELYAVAAGPGSFTGLRIGLATVQGLALVHDRPVAAVSALQASALAASGGMRTGHRIGVWMDAHRREVFSALYEIGATSTSLAAALIEVEAPVAESPAAARDRWLAAGEPFIICGDGALTFRALLPEGVVVAPVQPLASSIARLGVDLSLRGGAQPPAAVQPLYVRRPDVEMARDRLPRKTP